jgi:hypothetical protein
MSAEHSADPGQVSPFRKSKIVMRIGLIVVGLSTLTIMELGTPSRTKSAPDPFDQLMIDASASPDTLETADRLEMHQLQHEARFPPVSLAESPSDVSVRAPRNASTFEFGANNRKEDVVGTLKPKNTDKTRPNRTNSNKAPKAKRSKATVEVKPCRPKTFDNLLQALNLSSRCHI